MYVEEFITKDCGKRSAELPANQIESLPKIKRERGEKEFFAPLYTRFAFERWIAVIQLKLVASVKLSRQNLAASCTTASQNLAAVSGSHSLTETVDLGTMTLGGLIGTLHVVNNSFQNHLCSADLTLQQHIVIDHT